MFIAQLSNDIRKTYGKSIIICRREPSKQSHATNKDSKKTKLLDRTGKHANRVKRKKNEICAMRAIYHVRQFKMFGCTSNLTEKHIRFYCYYCASFANINEGQNKATTKAVRKPV